MAILIPLHRLKKTDPDPGGGGGGGGAGNGCIMINLGLGRTTPQSDAQLVALKVFALDAGPAVFTPESLYVVMGYTFKRLGSALLSDNRTPKEVVFTTPNGEALEFIFEEGQSLGIPKPGFYRDLNERLQMVDAEGWATVSSPVYYDLYAGDGTVWRFLASNQTGERGKFIAVTDSRGRRVTSEDMGVDVIRNGSGIRQVLTPSRLANITYFTTGYDVVIYPLATIPALDPATGLYVTPSGVTPALKLTFRKGDSDEQAYAMLFAGLLPSKIYMYRYVAGDWTLTTPSGLEDSKEMEILDSVAATLTHRQKAPDGTLLSETKNYYAWYSWGFSLTNKIEGFGDTIRSTAYTYVKAGYGTGQVQTVTTSGGLKTSYAYDSQSRLVAETNAIVDATSFKLKTLDYTPVDAADRLLPCDTRPRKKIEYRDGIEIGRTYYAYTATQEIDERCTVQVSPYGNPANLRTVKTWYPVSEGGWNAGRFKSIRNEDGSIEQFDYAKDANGNWVVTTTFLHVDAPEPVSGHTTRRVTVTTPINNQIERRTEVFVDNTWHVIQRVQCEFNGEGQVIREEDLLGRVTRFQWDCCAKTSEIGADGTATTYTYDVDNRLIAQSRAIPAATGATNYLTACTAYDAIGRTVAKWETNLTERVGTPVQRWTYDALGRVTNTVDRLGNITTYAYTETEDHREITTMILPNGATRITQKAVDQEQLSLTGTSILSQYYTSGVLSNGIQWAKTTYGAPAGLRWRTVYRNPANQIIREERPGFDGSLLVKGMDYDLYGRFSSQTSLPANLRPDMTYTYTAYGELSASVEHADAQTRTLVIHTSYVNTNGVIWKIRSQSQSCSDSELAPLVSMVREQITGLPENQWRYVQSANAQGGMTESWTWFDPNRQWLVEESRQPGVLQTTRSFQRLGYSVCSIDAASVTNTLTYDGLGRQSVVRDGRGNAVQTLYTPAGQRASAVDASGLVTQYSYNGFGQLVSVSRLSTNQQQQTTTQYEYDLRGNKTYEGGATYPVRYGYDSENRMISMTTYRDESTPGDTTRWLYDEATGWLVAKRYADNHGPSYSYTPDGKLAVRTWARQTAQQSPLITGYSYNGWGSLTNTVYSDGTPSISLAYDGFGRQKRVVDAAGITTFAYDAFGALTNETVVGVAGTNSIARYQDVCGRNAGYALNDLRLTTLGYDPETGRLDQLWVSGETNAFSWGYLAGSHLKQTVTYPAGIRVDYTYESSRDLLTQVKNMQGGTSLSQYDYTNDALGRRVQMNYTGNAFEFSDQIGYGYNDRSEVTNALAQAEAGYQYRYLFDAIGNRVSAGERGVPRAYTANPLNQYTAIDAFTPLFDLDANQTNILTTTGLWLVRYNGENRPDCWTKGDTTITMAYDRMGRRVALTSVTGGTTNTALAFVYDGYLQIAAYTVQEGLTTHSMTIWDPTESVATKPLCMDLVTNTSVLASIRCYAVHDANKNVSALVAGSTLVAGYRYAPFGAVAQTVGACAAMNPFRFSSEYADDELGLVYYNYRHYNPLDGRWVNRDPIEEWGGLNLYWLKKPVDSADLLGLCTPGETQNERAEVTTVASTFDPNTFDAVDNISSALGDVSNLQDAADIIKLAAAYYLGGGLLLTNELGGYLRDKGYSFSDQITDNLINFIKSRGKDTQAIRIWTRVCYEKCVCNVLGLTGWKSGCTDWRIFQIPLNGLGDKTSFVFSELGALKYYDKAAKEALHDFMNK